MCGSVGVLKRSVLYPALLASLGIGERLPCLLASICADPLQACLSWQRQAYIDGLQCCSFIQNKV